MYGRWLSASLQMGARRYTRAYSTGEPSKSHQSWLATDGVNSLAALGVYQEGVAKNVVNQKVSPIQISPYPVHVLTDHLLW